MTTPTHIPFFHNGKEFAAPVRHGFACFPCDHLPNKIYDKGRDFELVADGDIHFTAPGLTSEWLTIPDRSACDSVSTGRGLGRAIFGRAKNARVGLIHDWLYSLDAPEWITREIADEILYRAALYGGCAHWRASAAWLAVRWFGAKHYRKERMGARLR